MRRIHCVLTVSMMFAALAAMLARADAAEEKQKSSKTPDCVYVGTPNDVVDKMLEMAKIKKTDLVYDPGCGDGRMVVTAAKKYGCRGVGFEIDAELVARARKLAEKRKVDKLVEIKDEDIFKLDYSKADVISMYLLPEMIVRLTPQFEKMKAGSRIVAHDYPIRDMAADRVETVTSNEDNVKHTIYLYTLPLKKSPQPE
jgi:cyclopropane fatty-acyl-phospholipid synthase-like methyltransferase